jgi:NAD(P)H-hydrate repair Nnr-like enzyme with NAD(P)H-hydrate dehydratase domain
MPWVRTTKKPITRAARAEAATAAGSAALAVFLHGLCGGLAAKKYTERCVLAGELLDFLPAALRCL